MQQSGMRAGTRERDRAGPPPLERTGLCVRLRVQEAERTLGSRCEASEVEQRLRAGRMCTEAVGADGTVGALSADVP